MAKTFEEDPLGVFKHNSFSFQKFLGGLEGDKRRERDLLSGVVSDLPQRPVRCLCGGTPLDLSSWLCFPQSKTLEELLEIYASATDAQEIAAASSDPVLARERLQSVLQDIAGAASFPAITGEEPPPRPLFPPGFSTSSASAVARHSPALRVLGASSVV